MTRYVVVGGVAGGATAATRLRRLCEDAEIVVLERGPYVSFANCGLPYGVGGVIKEREALLVSTPEKLREEFNIDVRTLHEVVAVRAGDHEVGVRDLATGQTYTLHYDKLLLSPGAKPFVPPAPGIDLPGVFTLRSILDMDRIKQHIEDASAQKAVVVGGGFIGLEMAENLHRCGQRVTVVELLPQVMTALDYEMAAMLHAELEDNEIELILGDGLSAIQSHDSAGLDVILSSGRRVRGDLVLLALGVRPESELARSAGLALGPRGHIVVDSSMRTSDPDIYAVGDAVQTYHRITGQPCAIPLAGPANRQARVAADNMVGRESAYPGTLGTSIVQVFGRTAACTGANSDMLTREGIPFLSHTVHSHDHVGYYPGATPLTIKLLYTPGDGRLLGAQVVGTNGVDRTIDVLATALTSELTVHDLEKLELAYAPPFGAAKDPVNIAGFAATNRLRGDSRVVTWDMLTTDGNEYGILDVRSETEWEMGHLEGAVHIPSGQIRQRLGELDPSKTWVCVCKIGRRAYVVERILAQAGLKAATLAGGLDTYQAATRPLSAGRKEMPAEEENRAQMPAIPSDANAHITSPTSVVELDACGLQCPGPIMAVYQRMQSIEPGTVLQVTTTDPGFRRDVAAWCERTGNPLLGVESSDGHIVARIQKGTVAQADTAIPTAATNNKTMVVFSGELDKVLAAFVIANGAAAMGQQVTLFFTFWGLNALRKKEGPHVAKNLVERLFGWMLPRGADRLKLSKLNMGGLGTKMMKAVMRSKRIDSLPELMAKAQEQGVRLIACQMSMDMMGIKPEELIDGVEIGGVATFINETDRGNASLFI